VKESFGKENTVKENTAEVLREQPERAVIMNVASAMNVQLKNCWKEEIS
jgi:hypothetical protein